MGDLLNSKDIDMDKLLELSEVVQEYMIASEDKNIGLKKLKKQQFKQLYKELFALSMSLDGKKYSERQKKSYLDELEALSDMTLELIEEYMGQMDFDESELMNDAFMWSGGNLGPEQEKSYSEWLKHYGVEDDEEEDN